MGAYKVRQYCRCCKKVVNATMEMDTEHIDGRTYESGVAFVKCDYCGSIETEDYDTCTICGGEKPESANYCSECYDIVTEHLNDLRNVLKASADDFEEIVCNVLGI